MKILCKTLFLAYAVFLVSCATDANDEDWNASNVCPESGRGTFVDERDGQTYKYTTIGNQVWMAQNLNYHVEKGDQCLYEDDDCALKGRLYNIENIFDACPNGWHLPSKKEWLKMLNQMGGEDVAGMRLKAKEGWIALNPGDVSNGSDDCGFSILPALAEFVELDGYEARFLGEITYEETGKTFLWIATITSGADSVFTVDIGSGSKSSVRCVKD